MYLNVGKKEDLKKQKTRGSHETFFFIENYGCS
jgi:hypothetical protein